MDEDEIKDTESKETEETTEEKPEVKEKPEGKKEEKVEQKVDLDALTERIRKEEKEKLYASFEKYKADAKTAEEARKAAEAKLKEYENKNLTAEEQAALRFTELEESNKQLKSQLQEIVTLANDKITALQLELAKKEILSKYGDEIIEELVSGNSLEELAESAEKAHRRYKVITEAAVSKAKETPKQKEQIGTGLGPSSDKLNSSPTIADIKKIDDPKEWEKMKAKLLEEALRK